MKKWRCKICGYVYEGDELPEDFTEQARQAFENVKAIVEAAGGTMDNVMKITGQNKLLSL